MTREEKNKQIRKIHDDQVSIIENSKNADLKDKLIAFFQVVAMENQKQIIARQFPEAGVYSNQ